jgi:hypothetical protein
MHINLCGTKSDHGAWFSSVVIPGAPVAILTVFLVKVWQNVWYKVSFLDSVPIGVVPVRYCRKFWSWNVGKRMKPDSPDYHRYRVHEGERKQQLPVCDVA